MFDDVKINDNKEPANQPASGSTPLPEKKDGPAEPVITDESTQAAQSGKAEDIFSEVDKTKSAPAKPAVFQPKIPPSLEAEEGRGKTKKKITSPGGSIKKLVMLAVIIVLGGILGYGGYWGYNRYFKASVSIPALPEGGVEDQPSAPAPSVPAVTEPTPPPSKETTPSPEIPQDSDQDGLTNEEERALGTDIGSVDSDDDGLFDREEINVYKTDPLVSDTDGDGFLDGDEVKAGYNPLGAGMLYEIE